MSSQTWWIYIIQTKQNQLYTGITTEVERRLQQHIDGKGAKFLRGRGPLSLKWQQQVGSHSDALKLEIKVKKLSKAAKLKLITGLLDWQAL